MTRNDKEIMKKAANEVKYLTEEVKVIIGISGRYFLYNVSTDRFKADMSLPYSQWFAVKGSEEFNNYIKEKCDIATMKYGEFTDDEKKYICSEAGVLVVSLQAMSYNMEKKAMIDKSFAGLHESTLNVAEALRETIISSNIAVDLFNSIMECVEAGDKTDTNINDMMSNVTEIVRNLIILM